MPAARRSLLLSHVSGCDARTAQREAALPAMATPGGRRSRSPPAGDLGGTVYVGNLSHETERDTLRDAFSVYGRVTNATVRPQRCACALLCACACDPRDLRGGARACGVCGSASSPNWRGERRGALRRLTRAARRRAAGQVGPRAEPRARLRLRHV
jgi:hypothetical protein